MSRSHPAMKIATAAAVIALIAAALAAAAPARRSPTPPEVVINEVLVDPASGEEGDANRDGIRDTFADEFIELVNRGGSLAEVGGWLLGAAGNLVALPGGTTLAPGEYLALFGGGQPTGLPGKAIVSETGRIGAGLSNSSGRLLLVDPAGPDTLQDVTYAAWDVDASMVRDPEGDGIFVDHRTLEGASFSPSGPSTSGGGPDRSMPAIYRLRIVNQTNAGFQVAWRTATPAAARMELTVPSLGTTHLYDPAPAGLLHIAGRYGFAPATSLGWRVVSGGRVAPTDSMNTLVTGPAVPTVPYTVYGNVYASGSGAPSADAHIYLRAMRGGDPTGWLATVAGVDGSWWLNLGNLRLPDGTPFTWGMGDTLVVESDGGADGIASATAVVAGTSPLQVTLPELEPDPPPFFEWLTQLTETVADSEFVLRYRLQDPGGAWAVVRLEPEGGGARIPAETDPPLLATTLDGTVIVRTASLPEGTRWQIHAVVEDGLNPPLAEPLSGTVIIAHATVAQLAVPAGVRLLTPTLEDPALSSATGWLSRLPSGGEIARWEILSGSWISAARLSDGTLIGPDFATVPGEGYALVSAQEGTIVVGGSRRYAPTPLSAPSGLTLVGVADSSAVRTASAALAAPGVRAVSHWDSWTQRWEGRFRLPDGTQAGADFPIGWGDAVAIEADSAISWQPVAAGRVMHRPLYAPGRHVDSLMPGLWTGETGPGVLDLYWAAGAVGRIVLRDAAGADHWSQAVLPGEGGWQKATVGGLPAGPYVAELEWSGEEGTVRLTRTAVVPAASPPPLPHWIWGLAPAGDGLLLLVYANTTEVARRDGGGYWYAARRAGLPDALLRLTPDGGWDRWPLLPVVGSSGPLALSTAGAPISLSGLELDRSGPLRLQVRFRILSASGALSFRPFFGWDGRPGGSGPAGDPRRWEAAGEERPWTVEEPSGVRLTLALGPGPEGQEGPEAVAVRITLADGSRQWVGPAPLVVPVTDGELALLPAVPNPFNPETSIRYRLPPGSAREVSIQIHDIRGRRVRILRDAPAGPGLHEVRWDGRDGSGSRVAAGIYLVLLEVDGRRLSRKVLLLK